MKRGIRDAIAFAVAFSLVAWLVVALSKPGDDSFAKAVGAGRLNELKSGRELTQDELILKIGDRSFLADNVTKTFTVTVDLNEDNWDLGKMSGRFKDGSSAEIYFEESYKRYDKKSVVLNGKRFKFIAIKDGRSYAEYDLVFARPLK